MMTTAIQDSTDGDTNTSRLFTEGDTLYDAMLADIATARNTIKLESYIFADDEIGQRFARALSKRSASGVRIQLHLDAAGSLFWHSRRLERELKKNGVEVRWFHRWSWRNPLRYNRRNHRKLLVIDDSTAYVGGFNIHRENSYAIYGKKRWRDTHVQFFGGLAVQAGQMFDRFWKGNRRWLQPQPINQNLLVPNYSLRGRFFLNRMFSDLISGAHRSIFITTPYFVPDQRSQRLLTSAAQRGVDVRLLVPNKSDNRVAQWAAHAAYDALLRHRVRIFEYKPRMLHAKTAIVDGKRATVGTANFDYRSLFLNYELNLFTPDSILCQKLHEQFKKDLMEAEEIHLKQWNRRLWISRLFEFIGWIARRWL